VALRNVLVFIQAADDPASQASATAGWTWAAVLALCGFLQPLSEHVWIL
jgi:hypothetical protein